MRLLKRPDKEFCSVSQSQKRNVTKKKKIPAMVGFEPIIFKFLQFLQFWTSLRQRLYPFLQVGGNGGWGQTKRLRAKNELKARSTNLSHDSFTLSWLWNCPSDIPITTRWTVKNKNEGIEWVENMFLYFNSDWSKLVSCKEPTSLLLPLLLIGLSIVVGIVDIFASIAIGVISVVVIVVFMFITFIPEKPCFSSQMGYLQWKRTQVRSQIFQLFFSHCVKNKSEKWEAAS